jgi:hypothetical protein
MQDETMIDETEEESGESSNRMFMILAGGLAALFVVGLICIAAVFFVQRNQAASIQATNAAQAASLVESIRPSSVLSGDLGVASRIKGCRIYLDISCNAFNDVDVGYYNGLEMTPTISPELSLSELSEFKDKRFAVYAHGRVPLMTTKYRLADGELEDELGYAFPVRCEMDYKQVLNSVPLGLYEEISRLREIGIVEYLLDLEGDVSGMLRNYAGILAGRRAKKPPGYTLGHFKKGVA